MDENYDIIILGTGLKECIISGLLSADGKKVLHIDRNDHYGAETASYNLKDLYAKFKDNSTPNEERLGDFRSYIVDRCPKFIMACGNLVKTLVHTKVTRYLEFKVVQGSYVYKDKKLYKMPSTPSEALSSNLMGFFQKRRLKNFLTFVQDYDENDKTTQRNLKTTIRETMAYFGLDENSVESVGHALALQTDDKYLDDPSQCVPFIKAMQLYAYSVNRHGKSPFIYPIYSLSGLPEGFARLSAIHGGVYMLNKPIDEILYDETGKVSGVKSMGEVAHCKQILGDPSYFGDNESKSHGRIARWIFILNHPLEYAEKSKSCQVIIPGNRMGRKHDIYIAVVSDQHLVCPEGKYLAMISTKIETNDPQAELEEARKLLGEAEENFFFTTDFRKPTAEFDQKNDGTFMSSSYDATSHFETVSEEVLKIYERISGKKFDLSIKVDPENVKND